MSCFSELVRDGVHIPQRMTSVCLPLIILCIFFVSEETRGTELQNALACLIAVTLGTPPLSNHLERHVFCPHDLQNTFVPGSMVGFHIIPSEPQSDHDMNA